MIGILALLLPIWLGWAMVDSLWPRDAGPQRLLKVGLGVAVGYGVVSLIFYLWLRILGPPGAGLVIAEFIVAALLLVRVRLGPSSARTHVVWWPLLVLALGLVGFVRTLFHTDNDLLSVGLEVAGLLALVGGVTAFQQRQAWPDLLLRNGFLATLALAIATAVFQVLNRPLGSFDAWVTWTMRARFLFRSGDHWRDGFTNLIGFAHPDYPLFVPASVVNAWMGAGRESLLEPACFGAICAVSVVLLLYAALRSLRDASQAMVGVLLLIGTALFQHCASDQTADIPLSLICLATAVLAAVHAERPESGGVLVLTGVTCGLGCWVKNDGMIFVLAFSAAWMVTLALQSGLRSAASQGRIFAAGLLPVVALVVLFKLAHAPPNEEMGMVSGAMLDPTRYRVILYYFASGLINFGGGVIPPAPVLLIYTLLMGRGPRKDAGVTCMIVGTCALMTAAYFVVYLTSRYYEGIQGMYPPGSYFPVMAGSLHREMLHMWPALLFGILLMTRSPQEQN